MLKIFVAASELGTQNPLPLHAVLQRDLNALFERVAPAEAVWLRSTGFAGKESEFALLPGEGGGLAGAVLGLGAGRDPHALALFSERLPPGIYRLANVPDDYGGARALHAWAIGT